MMTAIMAASAIAWGAYPQITTILVSSADGNVAVHCVAPPTGESRGTILFVHGASFPTRLAAGFEFGPADSWLHHAARQGYRACGMDFVGFGASDFPAAMNRNPEGAAPLTRAADAGRQIAAVVDALHDDDNGELHLVAHSWGTLPAARFAAEHSGTLDSLTLFGPVVAKSSPPPDESTPIAWYPLAPSERYEQLKYRNVLPAGMDLLDPAVHEHWTDEFARSSAGSGAPQGEMLRIPEGPSADISLARGGGYGYDASKVAVPLLVVFGDYDTVVDIDNAERFMERFAASPMKWLVRIDHGTHVMHLEKHRKSLYHSVDAFIATVGTRK